MNPHLPDEAVEYGAAAEKAFTALGAVDVARRAEADPALRRQEVDSVMRSLGADHLDPRRDLDTAAAAGALCRAAGRVALPYPVAAAILRDADGNPTVAVANAAEAGRVDHGDLFPTWRLADVSGGTAIATDASPRLGSRLGPFVCDLRSSGLREAAGGTYDAAVWITLSGWRILGCVERALELAVTHVRDREQFGQKLSEFQAVQFQIADAAVAVAGLDELCRYTTWRTRTDPGSAAVDALALRLCALETARTVLRTSQQLHGAAGVCDEYDVSVLARHIQPDLRLPFGSASTAANLAASVQELGFEALFPQGGRRA